MGPLDMETYPEALHLKGAPPPPPHGTPYSREKGGKEKREGGREGGEASSGRGEGKEGSQAKEGGEKGIMEGKRAGKRNEWCGVSRPVLSFLPLLWCPHRRCAPPL